MTWKESDRARGTHKLGTPEGEASQDMERKRPRQGHSPTGDHIRREKLGHRKKVTGPGGLTSWRPQREGHIRTEKESNQVRGAHILETTEGGTSQDMERE